MIQEQMKFDRPFGPSEACPVKHAQAKIDRSRVDTDQFVLESELLSSSDLHPTAIEQLEKNLLVKLPWAMLIGIGEGGSTGGGDSQMFQFALTASQASADFSEGMGSAQLTEEHGNKLAPAGESPGMSFSFRFPNGLLELDSRKQL
jgi:hypothetical protein